MKWPTVRGGIVASLWLAGCTSAEAPPPKAESSVEVAAPVPPKTEVPDSTLVGPVQTGECPLELVPGRALGPVQLGMSRAQLEQTGLAVTTSFEDKATLTENVNVGPYRATLCDGKVHEAWLEDMRLGPDCVSYKGTAVARGLAREKFIELFSGCAELPPRIGGAFTQCHDGGLRLGYGMGEFLQVRVAHEGSALDDDCTHALDDGIPVPIESESLAKLVEQTVELDELRDYWHLESPDRRPLRIVGEAVLGAAPPFTKFGEPVVYMAADEAKQSGAPYLEFTALTSSETRARFEFRYDVEGIAGDANYVKRHGEWQLVDVNVAER